MCSTSAIWAFASSHRNPLQCWSQARLAAPIGHSRPKADSKYHIINGRFQYKVKSLQFTASANANYKRQLGLLDFLYGTIEDLFSYRELDAVAVRAGCGLHAPACSIPSAEVRYFLNQQLQTGQDSVYLSKP